MKKLLLASAMLTTIGGAWAITPDAGEHYRVWRPFNETVFYDGYNSEVFDKDKVSEDDIVRHTNYLYAKKLKPEDFAWFGEETDLNVSIGALCDNYDRIGNISLSLLPKGSEYAPSEDMRFELARFITPFMNMNAQPYEVPYHFDARLLSMIFRDKSLQENYDFWLEFEIFGIPYAANQQITGCGDRNDVFKGTLEFVAHDEPASAVTDHLLVPIYHKIPEIHGDKNLNNHNPNACDQVGETSRTWKVTVPEDLADASITLQLSNHGANAGGEEYNRRQHFVYFDGELIATFTPGGKSCEPYRFYNTQRNGIYGSYPKSDRAWANNSNWCPGDLVPIRVFNLGKLAKGEHTFNISVPDAVFADSQGDIRVSMYLQGARTGQLPSGIDEVGAEAQAPSVSYNGSVVTITGMQVSEISIHSYDGAMLWGRNTEENSVSLVGFASGIYLVTFTSPEGETFTYKAVRN